jgi:mRNA-degrading endonuclease RelE of RelBE toxin-antitoxin system
VSRYTVYVTPGAWKEMKRAPGHVRQRIKRAVEELSQDPRPATSKQLEIPGLDVELRRVRLDRWRIVYAVADADKLVDVLAVRQRPPYDDGDLGPLIERARDDT